MASETAKKVMSRLSSMASQRDTHVDTWRQCYEFTFPMRKHGFFGEITTAREGLNELAQLNDSTTSEAVRTWAAHMIAGMTPANALWFSIDIGGENEDEKRWLSTASRSIWEFIHNSNFDSVNFELMIDAAVAGWFVLYIDEAREGGYHFEQWPIAQCYISSSRANEPIDTIYRKFKLRADQAVSEYGDDVSENIKEAIKKNEPHKQFEFIHAIQPREGGNPNARFAKNLPFESMHIEVAAGKVVRESGYHEFPCAVPRYVLIPETAYAVGPVFEALPDAATLNKIKELEYANLDMAVGGLWVAEDDGVLNPRSIKIGARRIIVANSVDSIKPLGSSTDFNVAFTEAENLQAQIRRIMLADVLPPLDGQPRTATEINTRMNMLRQMLGPIFGRLQSEYLQVMIERCFGLALRAGALGQPPETLDNRVWHVKYESPLARSQKLVEVEAIDNYVAGLANIAQLDPSAMDNVDLDKAARFRGEALGVPAEIIPTMNDVAATRVQRQVTQQAQTQQAIDDELQLKAGEAAIQQAAGAGTT